MPTPTTYRCCCVLTITLMSFLAACAKRPSENLPAKTAGETPSTSKPIALITEQDEKPSLKPTVTKLPAEDLPLLRRYQQANAYSDRATLKLTYLLEDGRQEHSETQIETRLERPNRIRLRVTNESNVVAIVSDGKQTTAQIIDPVTANFQGQVVVRNAPVKPSIAHLYEVTELIDPISPDEMLSALLGVPAGLDVLPLGLLTEEGKLNELASAKTPHVSLGEMELATTGETCEVIEAEAEEGKYRLWIRDGVVRRMELPPLTQNLLPGVRQMSLIVELQDVTFAAADSDFHLPKDGVKVRHFVLPPISPPTQRLGEKVATMSFQNRSGREVQIANHDGQITVLVWFGDRPESRMVLQSIEQVRRRNRSDRVRFAAVATEPAATHQRLDQWDVETAWLQDRMAVGRDLLGIEQAPTILVLGSGNSVQYFEVGANPNVGADVASVVERLLAGQDVATATKTLLRETEQAYAQLLARAKIEQEGGWVEELGKELPAASEPQGLSLKERWTTDKVKDPGNLLVVPGKKKQILVAEGWREMAMLGLDGSVTRHIDLELPENEGISILRAGSNGRDEAFIAAASRGGRYAFVFSFAGKLKTQYPEEAGQQYLVSDLLIHSIDNDEPELIVGWQGSYGVHGVGLDGKQRWSNQATPGVISIAPVKDQSSGSDQRPLLVAGESGLLFLVDGNGRTLREVRLDRVVHELVTWPGSARGFDAIVTPDQELPEQDAVHLGTSSAATGERVIHGINREWKIVWSHALPRGVYRHQVDSVQSITLPEIGPTWLMAGPDGSVHFVSTDGEFRDAFYVGRHIRGLASVKISGAPVLLVATDKAITAYDVSPAEAKSE